MSSGLSTWMKKLVATLAANGGDGGEVGGNPATLAPVGAAPDSSSVVADATRSTSPGAAASPGAAPRASAGLHINLIFDSNVTASPNAAAFEAALTTAASIIEAAYSNPITLNVAVGWGEYLGVKLNSATSAVGGAWSSNYSYGTVKTALLASSASADDASAYATLPASFNANASGSLAVYSAQAKALGLTSGSGTALDGFLGFGTGVPASNWIGVGLHEITHALGRISGYAPYSIEDLFRYSAPGTRQYAGGSAAYFSADGGTTAIANFATTSDYGDWAGDRLTANDPFNAFYSASTSSVLSSADLRLLDVIGYTPASASSTGGFAVSATAATRLESPTSATPFTFTVFRGGSTASAATVAWSVAGSGANPADAADFVGNALPSGTLNFAAGQSSQTITVSVAPDALVEPDEGFTLTLANPSAGTTITTASASGAILNVNAGLAIAAANATRGEGLSGSTPFTFTVTRGGFTGSVATAHWAVSGTGATPATTADFVGASFPSGTVTFVAGQTSQTITVNVQGAPDVEPDASFNVTLSNPATGTLITTAAATGVILGNHATSALSIAALSANRFESATVATPFTFTVTRAGTTTGTSTATYVVAGSGPNPADAADFVGGKPPSGTVTFAPDQTSQTVTINVAPDGLIEPDEGFIVTLANPSTGTAITGGGASGIILNGNAALSIAASSATRTAGATGTSTPYSFTVTRGGYLGIATSANWTVAGIGSSPADAGDFVGAKLPSGTVTFGPGQSSQTITLPIAGDSTAESNEAFAVTLATPTNGVGLATASAAGTILTPGSSAPTSGLKINLQWDTSVASAPAGFKTAIQTAANILQAALGNSVTLNIAVGWGEIGGSAINNTQQIAEGGPNYGAWVPYGSVKSTLIASAQSAQDSSAYASLPASLNPNGNGSIAVWSAQEKALGLISPTASGTDGEIGFSTSFPSALWVGAALHELTHAMGRTSGYAPYGIEDLLRYSAPGVHIYAGGTTSYASVDGGTTVLAPYANSSDYGDLATNTADPFNAYIPSGTNSLTATDTTLMDIIGFTLTPGTASAAKPSFVASATTTAPTAAPGDALFGELANFSGVYRGPSYDDDPPAGILTAQPMAMGALASTVAGAHPFLAGLLHG